MGTSSERVFNGSGKGYLPAGTIGNRTHILSERLKAGTEFKRLKKGHRPAPMPLKQTHILSYKPLSQTRFGLMVGLSRQMINTLECRGCNIQIDSLQRIADGLDIPAWKLLEDHAGECTERESSHSTHTHRDTHVCW